MVFSTIYELLRTHAERTPDATAMLALDRAPLSYGRLLQQAQAMGVRDAPTVAGLAAYLEPVTPAAQQLQSPAYSAPGREEWVL